MPGIVAHMLCGEKAIANSACSELRNIIKRNHAAFCMGTQGPDPFMFYGVRPWVKREKVKDIQKHSDHFHDNLPNAPFRGMLQQAYNSKSETQIAYMAGFLMHHVLDSETHPYVYYLTESAKRKTYPLHQIFESQLDLGVLQMHGLTVRDYRVDKNIKTTKKENDQMALVVKAGLKSGFNIDQDEKLLSLVFKDVKECEAILYDPNGIKGKFLAPLEKLFKMEGIATSILTPITYDNKLDCMNYRKEEWYMPTDETIQRDEDFEQLFNMAAKRGANVLESYEKYIEGTISLEQMLDVVGDRSFATGRSDLKPKYFFKLDQK